MSLLNEISDAVGAARSAAANLLGGFGAPGGGAGGSFFARLQPASLGGVRFGVLGGKGRFGRRQAVHEYPFRDTPWVEDLGKSARRITLTGFLIENSAIYGGGNVIAQRDALIAVAEAPDAATLVHPTLGRLDVSVSEIEISEKWDQGRYFEINFSFVESGQRAFPSVSAATGGAVDGFAAAADLAANFDFVSDLVGAAQSIVGTVQGAVGAVVGIGQSILGTVQSTVGAFVAIAGGIVQDATGLFGMVVDLPGAFGRYFGGALAGFLPGAASAARTVQTSAGGVAAVSVRAGTAPARAPTANAQAVARVVAQGAAARARLEAAVGRLEQAAARGVPDEVAGSVQALVASALAAMPDPADALRLLPRLSAFAPAAYTTSSPIGLAMERTQVAVGKLCRRAAVVALARASTTYGPASAPDAVRVRHQVTALLDAEIAIAGDDGEDASFAALRALRQAVVADLNRRGAALPALKTFTFQASLPAAVLALRLYRDAGRADEIVGETDAPHPAFQPRTVRVLAT